MSVSDDHRESNDTPTSERASAPTEVTPLKNASPSAEAEGTTLPLPAGLVATTLDSRYFIEMELGHGGVGVVYLARDRRLLDKQVVVKVLLEKSLRNERIVQKFQQEKEALTRVDHPGIIGILDTGELPDGKPYIVMPYVDGATLRSALFPEGMPLERVANIARQMGSALAAVHQKGILHRDLKPENIMLQSLGSGEEQVRIIDFGIAKIKNSLVAFSTMTPTTLGTYGYMSPEQFRGEPVTVASDIYSLGVIAYEMVTGRRPFNPESVAHLCDEQSKGVRVKPKDLRPAMPEAAQQVILRALMFDPTDRYDDARSFGDKLSQALLNEGPKSAAPLFLDAQSASTVTDGVSTLAQPATPNAPASRFSFSLNTPWLKIAVSFVFVAAFITATFGLFTFKRPANSSLMPTSVSNANAPTRPVDFPGGRSMNYWLTVQKMRDGKPYQEPFKSSGREIFESGYRFRLNVSSPHSGYLYVFNEGASANGALSFTLLYPTPLTNDGSPEVPARQSVQTGWNVFQGTPGTEQFWIVWSASPVAELEDTREAALQTANGSVMNAALVRRVREFLSSRANQAVITKDSARQETVVKGIGDPIVSLIELEHR